MPKKQDKTLEVVAEENNTLDAVDVRFANIPVTHELVSQTKTPKAYIKDKMGMEYVEIGYMKKQADLHYPGWSWQIIGTEFAGTEAFVVHGRLMWYDSGVKRVGDMTAAHRIQKSRKTDSYVDLGNDIKSANTDCMKKAFNMYMNIADDVYRNQVEDPELSDFQRDEIVALAESISEEQKAQIESLIESGDINNLNYKGALAKLKRIA